MMTHLFLEDNKRQIVYFVRIRGEKKPESTFLSARIRKENVYLFCKNDANPLGKQLFVQYACQIYEAIANSKCRRRLANILEI